MHKEDSLTEQQCSIKFEQMEFERHAVDAVHDGISLEGGKQMTIYSNQYPARVLI